MPTMSTSPKTTTNTVLIIGGGAAGMLAAIGAAQQGAQVTLLERNEKLGKKIYITGKGRCNVTNACDNATFMRRVVKNPRFLYSALEMLSPEALMEQLQAWGCPTMVERGNRVYPRSERASDVTKALADEMRRLGVRVYLSQRVQTLWVVQGVVQGVTLTNGDVLRGDCVVVATGGMSYPSTGSTGDGFRLLQDVGHTVFPPLPTLVPLTSDAPWIRALQGVSLKNVRLSLYKGKKCLFSDLGEMLFTHFGISGPLALSASAYACEHAMDDLTFTLDLKTGLSEEQLQQRLLRDIEEGGKKQMGTLLSGLVPHSLALQLATLLNIDERQPANTFTKAQRLALVQALKALPLPIQGTRPLQEAVVTRGGVSVKEVNPKTMQSKVVQGLYIAGELLDVDALTGGYNLQIAFATGYVAGKSAGDANRG